MQLYIWSLPLCLAFCFWVVDALLDHIWFYVGRSYKDLVATAVPAHEVDTRITVWIFFLIFGYICYILSKQREIVVRKLEYTKGNLDELRRLTNQVCEDKEKE